MYRHPFKFKTHFSFLRIQTDLEFPRHHIDGTGVLRGKTLFPL